MRFLKFLGSNARYIIWFLVYFSIAWLIIGDIFGYSLFYFFVLLAIYGVSISIALSPFGELILRSTENCREPSTVQEQNYLLPMFEEVYQDALEAEPKLNKGIKIYIMDAMYANAFAIGRQTVAVTRGAMEILSADELKGVIAHELGHINYGHTKAMLLSLIGNFFFSVIVWTLRLILSIFQFISEVVAQFNIVGFVLSIFTSIFQIVVNVSVLVFINLSEVILSSNSRSNELQADTFAYEIGYGEELASALYIFQKMSMNNKMTLSERMKASHPHIARRIENLEQLNQSGGLLQ